MSARTRGINPITIKDVLFKKLSKSKVSIERKILGVGLERNKSFKIIMKNHEVHLCRVILSIISDKNFNTVVYRKILGDIKKSADVMIKIVNLFQRGRIMAIYYLLHMLPHNYGIRSMPHLLRKFGMISRETYA